MCDGIINSIINMENTVIKFPAAHQKFMKTDRSFFELKLPSFQSYRFNCQGWWEAHLFLKNNITAYVYLVNRLLCMMFN